VIIPQLFKKATALDANTHRHLRFGPAPTATASGVGALNSVFVAAVEFGDVCVDYPIVFVNAGQDPQGKPQVAPIAVMGLAEGENLMMAADGTWRAAYQPALLRAYPFSIARLDDNRAVVVVDEAWSGWAAEGTPLFNEDGSASPQLTDMRDQLEKIENEVQRTRWFCNTLLEAGLLSGMRFEATMPDGSPVKVDGFQALDEAKFAELPDAQIVEFHRNGVLALIHAHQISLRNMRRLAEWRAQKMAA
jgi:hypothetical protein